MNPFKRKSICLIVLALLLAGCGLFETKEPESVEALLVEGTERFNAGDYRKALKAFEKIKDWYPFSKYAIVAELKIADAHYHLEEYEEAIFAYEEFQELHPRNEAIPYVIYQLGRCYFDRINTIDRDQSFTRKALDIFMQLQAQHPRSEYAEKASGHINRCHTNLAKHEFYVGRFYYKSGHYRAALQRFQNVLTRYPDVGVQKEALQYIAECKEALREVGAKDPEAPISKP